MGAWAIGSFVFSILDSRSPEDLLFHFWGADVVGLMGVFLPSVLIFRNRWQRLFYWESSPTKLGLGRSIIGCCIGISLARGNIKRNIWAVGRQGSGKMVYWCMVPLPLVDAGPIPDVCCQEYCSV